MIQFHVFIYYCLLERGDRCIRKNTFVIEILALIVKTLNSSASFSVALSLIYVEKISILKGKFMSNVLYG